MPDGVTLHAPIHWVGADLTCRNATIWGYEFGLDGLPTGPVQPSVTFGNNQALLPRFADHNETEHGPSTWHWPHPHQGATLMSLPDRLHAIAAALKAERHHLADEAHAVWQHLVGDEKQLQTEAAADAKKLETDAMPVIQEAQADAEHLATEAVAAIHTLPTPPQPEPPAAA